ncbi:MAG: oligosaccharide flippase family protein, partial [Chloroflexota bacterium]
MTDKVHAETALPTRADALGSALWAAAGSLARYLLAGITTLALARLLAPSEFGLVALTVAAQELIAHVAPVGLHDALIQRPRLDRAARDSAWWSTALVSGALALATIALAGPLARVFEQPRLAGLLAAAALAALIRALSMPARAVLARRLDFRTLTLSRVLGMVAGGVAAIALAALGAGVWSLIAQAAILNLTGALLVWRAAGWRPGRWDRAALV